MKTYAESAEHNLQQLKATSPHTSAETAIRVVAVIMAVAVALSRAGTRVFGVEEMYIVQPLVVAAAVFVTFAYVLSIRTRTYLFGELGFIYVGLALAYTIIPGIIFLSFGFNFPIFVDGQTFLDLSPKPQELGTHFWRHVLFIVGVATGYLAVRGGALHGEPAGTKPSRDDSTFRSGRLVAIWIGMIAVSIFVVTVLSAPVTNYWEHYSRFDHLGWLSLRLVYVCLIIKGGGYLVLLSLLFREYGKYRTLIFVIVPLLGIYETVYSFGSRIETLVLLLTCVGLYHHQVSSLSMRKGAMYLTALAVLFSGIELYRTAGYSFQDAATSDSAAQLSEFGAVYNTSFHLFSERANGTLPPRPWQMFFYEFIAVVPFLDHTRYHPQYWYARNYFPSAPVPPSTMGVISDSAIWGGEWDLLLRSLINGALYAYLTRWFLRRRKRWFASTLYIFLCATCVLTLKYSVLYQVIPLVRMILPTMLINEILRRLTGARAKIGTARVRSLNPS